VLSAGVAARRRELAIRAALGCEPSRLLTGVVAEALTLSAVGIVIGVALSSALGRAFGRLLFGVGSGVLPPLAMAAGLLITLAIVASVGPARRAARVDPLQVLRND
jgi:putative ABC transport system permease protein